MIRKLGILIVSMWSLIAVAAPTLPDEGIKLPQFTPVRTVPAADVVKEVGGIQYGKHIDIKLDSDLTVRCFPAATNTPEKLSPNWYYLPTNPRISTDKDGTPKFSMVRFVTDKAKSEGGVEGAILHFMVEYGLDKKQVAAVEKELKKRHKNAVLKGAVPLEQGAEGSSFQVVSATLNDEGFTTNLITSGKAPIMEGQRVAVAARLDQYGATLLSKSLENPTADISVVFDLQYVVKLPAYDVSVEINYDQYREVEESLTQTRDKETRSKRYWDPKMWNVFNHSTRKTTYLTEQEQSEVMDYLQETGVVTFIYNQNVPDGDKEIVESGLHKLVMESFFDMQNRLGTPSDDEMIEEEEGESSADAKAERQKAAAKVKHYRYEVFKRKSVSRQSTQRLSLKKVIARYEPYQMVGNIGNWFAQHKNNPKLFTEVNLDDPFFQRREVRFVIDNEAYDIFEEMVNYATVQVKVERKGQRPFIEELTIDKQYLQENGQTASVSFARMGDDAQSFSYATQWSLRGGHLYPAQPQWKEGELTVTLAAPVKPVDIEAETDLAELERMGFSRISVELRYKRFGKEYHDKKGLVLSPATGEAIASKTVYQDKSADKIAYRLIYHHKKLGQLEDTEWRELNGNYLYCLPSDPISSQVGEWLKSLAE